jgi:hypothetical protein
MAIVLNPDYSGITASMSKLVEQLINPDKDFQKGLRSMIVSNPAVMQQLADLEKDNPGYLKQLGAGKIGQTIASLNPSREYTQSKADDQYLAANPLAAQEAQAGRTRTQTVAQRAQQGATLDATRASTEASKGQTQYFELEQEKTRRGLAKAAKTDETLAQIRATYGFDVNRLLQDINTGKIDAEQGRTALMDEGYYKMVDHLWDLNEAESRFQKDKSLIHLRASLDNDTQDRAYQRMLFKSGIDMFTTLGGGNPQLWSKMLDSQGMAQAQAMYEDAAKQIGPTATPMDVRKKLELITAKDGNSESTQVLDMYLRLKEQAPKNSQLRRKLIDVDIDQMRTMTQRFQGAIASDVAKDDKAGLASKAVTMFSGVSGGLAQNAQSLLTKLDLDKEFRISNVELGEYQKTQSERTYKSGVSEDKTQITPYFNVDQVYKEPKTGELKTKRLYMTLDSFLKLIEDRHATLESSRSK